ncbi:hypothetical protein E2C01_063446 [Portunus trituberculatus]|uniref:Uncharacterized protein n=1 Tax=Portunus trituberculatus TaxID=210409 RepID=A0A5B7HHM3_PORTR|nr:hypothetical protein [Portunus trituberculatus]
MARVRIKHPHPNNHSKLQLLRAFSEYLIYATRIILTPDSFIVLTRSDEDIDSIFEKECNETLHVAGFEPILPPEMRAKRTVLVFNTDDYILSHSEDEIKQKIIHKNTWIKQGIDCIFKIPSSKILKIYFNSTNAAKLATDKGLLAFHMSIPSYNVKVEEFIPITTCMRCYAIEQHTTNKCTMPETHTVCSECASDKHTWKTCTSNIKKRLNCLANKCHLRKKIKEEKRKQNKNSSKTYSQATQNNTNSNNTNTQNINIEKDKATKILTRILHSHILNIANPGSYNDELNNLFKLNNLPSINLPPNPPSKNILSLTAECKINTKEVQVANEPDEEPEEELEIEEIEEEAEDSLHTIQATEKVKPPQPTPTPKIQGKNIGLKLITKRTAG